MGVQAEVIGILSRRRTSNWHHTDLPPPPQTRTTTPAAPPAAHTPTQTQTVARSVLVASRGPCWLSVHTGSATGQPLFERTLQPGRTARFISKRLWIRIGAPWNLDATLDGKT